MTVAARAARQRWSAPCSRSGWRSWTNSARHHGHAGWREGGETHFAVVIVAGSFAGRAASSASAWCMPRPDLLRDRIHALSITALAPGEAEPAS